MLARAEVKGAIKRSEGLRFVKGGQEEGAGVKEARERERKRVERGHGAEPRPGRAQSSRCKNANRAPPTQNGTEEMRKNKG